MSENPRQRPRRVAGSGIGPNGKPLGQPLAEQRRWSAGMICSFLLLIAGVYGLMPNAREVVEIQIRSSANLDKTIAIIEKAKEQGPLDESLDGRLLDAYEHSARYDKALIDLAGRGQQRPLTDGERARVKRVALAAGKPEKALPILAGPQEHMTSGRRRDLVKLAMMAGRPRVAKTHQKAIAVANAKDPKAWKALRQVAIACGDTPLAVQAQERLVVLAPDDPAWKQLSDLRLGAGSPAGAYQALARVEDPADRPGWHATMMKYAVWARRQDWAVDHAWRLYGERPSKPLGLQLAGMLAAVHDDRALTFARGLYERHPDDPRVLGHLQALLMAAHRVNEVRDLLQTAVKRHPDDGVAHKALVDFALGQASRGIALAELQRWLGRHGGDREARHQQAVVYVWDRQPLEGWNSYDRLLGDMGPVPEAPVTALERRWRTEWLGISTEVDDFTVAGRTNLRRLLAGTPDRLDWRRRLARAELEAGETAAALAEQRKVVRDPRAVRTDVMQLAEWLGWYGRAAEGLPLLRALDAKAPLPPTVLRDGAEQAALARRWDDATYFLSRLAMIQPNNLRAREDLARIRETAGDLPGSAAVLEARAQAGTTATPYVLAAGAWLRAGQPARALALLEERGAAASLDELRLRARLAQEVGPTVREEGAWHALLRRSPGEMNARLRLASLAERRGSVVTADHLYDGALSLAPNDPALALDIASSRVYGGRPERASRAIAVLVGLPRPGPAVLRVLADYFQTSEPRRAAAALDDLHAAGSGDAETHFRRGELAAALDDGGTATNEFERADQAARGTPGEPSQLEAGGYALERLGRDDAAAKAWESLAKRFPTRPAAPAAMARQRLRAGDLPGAERYVTQAETAAPEALEAGLVRGEWLAAIGRPVDAAEHYAGLDIKHPGNPYLVVAEAMARHGGGQYRSAHAKLLAALEKRPGAADLTEAFRQVRPEGASQVVAHAMMESFGSLDRVVTGATSTTRFNDRLAGIVDVTRHQWASGTLEARDVALGLAYQHPLAEATAKFTLPFVPTGLAGPLADLGLTWRPTAGFSAGARAAQRRWQDSNDLVQGEGRETAAGVNMTWQPGMGPLTLRGEAEAGWLSAGAVSGPSRNLVAEAALRRSPASPWTLLYQASRRDWGAAGPAVALPDALTIQRGAVIYGNRFGPLRVEVQPGVVHDPTQPGVGAVMSGAVALDLGRDAELEVTGAWVGRDTVVGQGADYQNVAVSGRWWF